MATIRETLIKGIALQNSGRVAEAERHYASIVRVDPAHPDALHLLGLIASERGEHEKAVQLIQSAIDRVPHNPTLLSNLGVTLRRAGRLTEAIEAYRQSIALEPDSSDAHYNLGKAYKAAQDAVSAKQSFRTAARLNPHLPSAWLGIANCQLDLGERSEALVTCREGLEHCPDSCALWMCLGAIHRHGRQVDESLAAYRQAVAIAPRNLDALSRLAGALATKRRLQEAQQVLARAQQLAPDSAPVLQGLAVLSKSSGDYPQAIGTYRRAIDKAPDSVASHAGISIALRLHGQPNEAIAHAQHALALRPKSPEVLVNLGATLLDVGRFDSARESLLTALEIEPGCVEAYDCLLMSLQYDPSIGMKEIYGAHVDWNQRFAAGFRNTNKKSLLGGHRSRVRLGFVSGDLGRHPVGYFSQALFEFLDRGKFELVVYSDRQASDDLSDELKAAADHWHEVAPLTDEELLRTIQQDDVDILFDLAGHTARNRLLTFARRAAPLQITWAGYVGTTGLIEMDYLLADAHHVPVEHEPYYTERVVRLPNDYVCYSPPANCPDPGPLPALSNGHVTFAAFANPSKVNPELLKCWEEILASLPNSHLILCYRGWQDPLNQSRIRESFASPSVAQRVRFAWKQSSHELFQLYRQVDIALDTFPYSGGLTTCEALWMGVPTVTMTGDRFAGRHATSHLINAGYSDWVTTSVEEYIERAVNMASQVEELSRLRRSMRSQTANSPLCDGLGFASDFESLILDLVSDHNELRV